MTTAAVDDGGGNAAADAGAETHRQSDGDDVEARLAGVEALLDQSARTLKTLHAAVVLSGGRPPVQAELDLAAEARDTLAAAARALPPRALLGGGWGGGGAGGAGGGGRGGNGQGDDDGGKLTRLATVERTVQNLGMLPPPVPVVAGAAGAAAAAGAAGATGTAGAAAAPASAPMPPPPPRQQ